MSQPKLNPAQARAVEHMSGPMLVLAGAGSGKTRVITQRIARMVERGVPSHAIVALTFTNKAAAEMAERVEHVLRERKNAGAAKGLTVSTFHSFGLSVLTREKRSLGGTFTIFDQGDCLSTVKDILSRSSRERGYDAPAILTRISNAKNAFISPEQLRDRVEAASVEDEYDAITASVYPRYQAALRGFRAFDFDDLVCEVARMFREKPDVLEKYRAQYRYLLVDEYQDTNGVQLALLRLLAGDHQNICVVGDDDQSIYSWRGANVRNILDFEEQFPGALVVKLEQNYRSRAPVLDVANAVIAKRADVKHKKVLFTEKAGGPIVGLGTAPSPEAEAAYVGRELARLTKEAGVRPKDTAVLYRSNGQAKLIEEALRERGVPYRMVGGQQFFERKEVKDLLAYLKVTLNRADEISLRRILNYPPRGIGETSVERLGLHAVAKGWTLWQAIERVDALDGVPSAAREGCKKLERAVGQLRKRLVVDRVPASTAGRELCEAVGIYGDLDASSTSPQVAARRKGNLDSILRTLEKREVRVREKGDDETAERELMSFLQALTLNLGDDEEDTSDRVTLSTLHGSKGLEFDHVFLIGVEEGFLPHTRTLDARATDASQQDIEEERRLFYVGITRAREKLVLTKCKARALRGKPTPRTPSRFLSDIPEELLETFVVKEDPAASLAKMGEHGDNLLAMLEGLGG
ncbi:MAG: UvrD-helicase domain-containing protein [Myxococcales bacterium]|nr:UvrD-helicase domain-containing protein [Myxococcales bacterium]HQY61068.1 UvrD-helicase domain-containing protein [Polyangiaceae bacterium]